MNGRAHDGELAAEQETIIQQIAWELFDPTSSVKASYGDAVEIDDARRGAVEAITRGLRIMMPMEIIKIGPLVQAWRSIEQERDALPGPRLMHLRLTVDSATEQQLRRGLKEAAAVFIAAGTDPKEAAWASFRRDLRADRYGHDDSQPDYPMMTERESKIADVWAQAHDAAIAACCAGWTKVPADAGLSLIRNLPLVPRSGPHIEFEAEV
jgi:hypothetical protein